MHKRERARQAVRAALRHLAGFPIRRMPLAPMLGRMWALPANVTADDAAYVVLAEQLAAPLVTCDAKLALPVERAAPST